MQVLVKLVKFITDCVMCVSKFFLKPKDESLLWWPKPPNLIHFKVLSNTYIPELCLTISLGYKL